MPFLQRILQLRWLLGLLLLGSIPFTLSGAIKAWQANENDVADWMPDDFEATRQLIRFVKLFGSDELLMISWEGCSIDDPRIETYKAELLAPVEEGELPLYREVLTGPEILAFYQAPPLNLERAEALQRMEGWLVSADHQLTCLIALVSKAGMDDRHAAIALARDAASRVPKLHYESVHLAGPTLEGVAIDEISQENLLLLNLGSFGISLLVMIICLRSVRASVLVFLIAAYNEQLSLAVIYYCGTQLNSILLLTANLTFVISISIGIHLVNYYQDALLTHSRQGAAAEACRRAWPPTALATITTALGLISLMSSEVKPIASFGAYSAICVVLSMFITLTYITIHFHIWPLAGGVSAGAKPSEKPDGGSVKLAAPTTPRFGIGWSQGLNGICRLRFFLLIGAIGILVWGYMGAQRLRTSVGMRELLSPRTRVVQDYKWLEANIGPLVPIEVVVEMPAGDARQTMEQFRVIARLHNAFREVDPNNTVLSSATFAPEPPSKRGGFRQIAMAAAFRRKLLESQSELVHLGYLHTTDERNFWRLTVRAPAMRDVDYGEVIADVEDTIAAQLKENERLDVIVSGGIPLVHQAQQQLLKDLIQSFLLAFGMVCVTLMIMFRSVLCGLVCMIPNILPSALVFGWMGWRDTPVEIGAILTASTALGIAVDDSLHFITWFRKRISEGATIREAILYSHRHCATAMIQTTLICTLGLLTFGLSDFTPIAKFSWCMLALLSTALVADLIVLPAILLTPLGRPFVPRAFRSSRNSKNSDAG